MILNIKINTSPSSRIFAKTQSGVLWLDTRAICIFWIFQNPPAATSAKTSPLRQLSTSSSSTKPRLNLSIETQLELNYFCFKFRLHLKVQSHPPDFFFMKLTICIFVFSFSYCVLVYFGFDCSIYNFQMCNLILLAFVGIRNQAFCLSDHFSTPTWPHHHHRHRCITIIITCA